VAQVVETHCTYGWEVTGSIPSGGHWIFHWHNPSGRTVFLWSTQPLTEMRICRGGKSGRC